MIIQDMQHLAMEFEILISKKTKICNFVSTGCFQNYQRIINEEIQVVEERPCVAQAYVSIKEDFGS